MKANELMIGDWIAIDEPDRYAGAIGHIQSLRHHNEDETAYFHVDIRGKYGYLSTEVCSDDIRPIELTRIHLTKNGFEAIDETDCIFVYEDGFEVRVEFVEDMTEEPFIFLNINFAEKHCGLEIAYVHQLQHLMR